MSELLRFWSLVIVVVICLVGITIALMKKYKEAAIAKYIPTLVMWLVSIFFLVMAILSSESMKDLGYLIMSMITGLATFITLIITLCIIKYNEKKQKNKK
ncbi:MAG: hypothetical protein PHD78_02675 [Bacilli bacterium]|nr:hypothetical protein [Bacilli bacterium]MDD4411536.1 hypothetical protein [Bacilli bacterium]